MPAASPIAPSLTNAGFESGLAGWTTSGNVSLVTNHTDHSAPDGGNFALMESGTVNVYNTVSQTFVAQAGQTISGYAFFHTTDYVPYNDDGRVVIKSGNTVIATVFSTSVSSVGDFSQTDWVQWQYTFSQSGTYTLEAGVRNIGDSGVSSYLGFDLPTSDTTAPSISLNAPADNALVHGIVSLQASASDNTGVAKVDFYVDESLVGSDTDGSDGWSIDLDTTQLDDGEHTWFATAHDPVGNMASTPTATFTVNNVPPVVEVGGNAVVGVGEQFERSGFFTDLVGIWTGTVNYGDGTVSNVSKADVVNEGENSGDLPLSLNEDKTFQLSHVYTKEGDFQVTVTISDGYHSTSKVIFVHTVIGSSSNVGQSETQTATPDTPAQTSEIKGNNEATAQGALELGTGATAPATLWIASYHNDPVSDSSQPQGNIQLSGQQATAVAFFDVRITGVEENSGAHATLIFKFEVDHDAADPLLLFKEASGNWVQIAGDPTAVTREASAVHPGMDLVTFVVTIDDFSTPKISGLGGTVFTVAVPSPAGTTTTTATVPTTTTVASTSSSTGVSGVPFPVLNTATFTSTNQLTLVLRVSEGTESSSSTTTLGTNATVGGNLTEDGGDLNLGENAGRSGLRPAGLRNLSEVEFLQQEFNVEWLWHMMNGGQPPAQPVVPAAPAQNQPQNNQDVNNQQPATPEEAKLTPVQAGDIVFAELGRQENAIFIVDGGSDWLVKNRDARVDCSLAMAVAVAGAIAPRLPKKAGKRRRSPALAHV